MACRELNITDYFIFHETKQALKGDLCFPQETEQALIYNFSFNSGYQDTESGLVYYNYRYYSPELGRWLSRDPIGEWGGYNLYEMVGDDEVGRWDVFGYYTSLKCCFDSIANFKMCVELGLIT